MNLRYIKIDFGCLGALLMMCNNIIMSVLELLMPNSPLNKPLLAFVLLLVLAIDIYKTRHFDWDSLLVVLLTMVIFWITQAVYPEYLKSYGVFWSQVIAINTGVFGYVFFRRIKDVRKFIPYLRLAGILLFVYAFLQYGQNMLTGSWGALDDAGTGDISYSQGFGYNMLLPVLVLLYGWLNNKNLVCLILGITGIVLIATCGSRATVLCVLVYYVMYIFLVRRKTQSSKKKFAMTIILILLGTCFIVFYKEIINSFILLFEALNINSRTITAIISGEFLVDQARSNIWELAVMYIKESPFFGYGAFGDQYLIGFYCHNIFLELLFTFGIIPGLILSLFLIVRSIRMLVIKDDMDWLNIFLIFFNVVFIKLMVTNTFWRDEGFWCMLALTTTYIRMHKKHEKKMRAGFDSNLQ